jgi:hypothetical protein
VKGLPVAYAGRNLNKAEKNYSTSEKELLPVVWGVKHFRLALYNAAPAIYFSGALRKHIIWADY